MLPVVRFSAIYDEMTRSGIIADQMGPQDMLNWMRSQVVNILKLMPTSGWIIGKDIDNYSQALRQSSGQAAQVIEKDKCGGSIEQIKPPIFPAGMHQISAESKGEIREVSNIRTENPEQDSEEQSGRAILAKQANSQTGISPYLHNFDVSLRIFGDLIITVIRCSNVFSREEIEELVEEDGLIDGQILEETRAAVIAMTGIVPVEPVIPPVEQYEQMSPEIAREIWSIYIQQKQIYEMHMQAIDKEARPAAINLLIDALRNPISGKYNSVVSLSPFSITSRLQNMANVVDTNNILLASQYGPLPEKTIYEASEIPNKESIIKEKGL